MEKKTVTLSEIKTDIENGLTRPEIKNKYGLTGQDMKNIFSHPKLKGVKAKKTSIIFIDDEAEEIINNHVSIPETEPEPIEPEIQEEVFLQERERETKQEEREEESILTRGIPIENPTTTAGDLVF